jgi:hypothetical protein
MKNPMTKATSQTQHAVSWRGAGSGVFLPAVSLLTIFVMATLSRSASAAGFDGDGEADEYVRIATGLGTLEHAIDAIALAGIGIAAAAWVSRRRRQDRLQPVCFLYDRPAP